MAETLIKKYLSSKCTDFKYLKRNERRKIAEELIQSGEFSKMALHDIEDMLRINTIDEDYPKNLGTTLSRYYKNESLSDFDKKRKNTEIKIKKYLYK